MFMFSLYYGYVVRYMCKGYLQYIERSSDALGASPRSPTEPILVRVPRGCRSCTGGFDVPTTQSKPRHVNEVQQDSMVEYFIPT